MTRKRLRKLLMAIGYDRNCANEAIDQCLADGLTHEEAYAELTSDDSAIAILLRHLADGDCDAFLDGIRKLNEAIKRAFSSVG